MERFNIKALSLSLGITWGLFLAFLGALASFGTATELVAMLGSYYTGFAPGIAGIVIGFIEGFVCAAIGGIIIGWLYNYFSK